MAWKTFEQIMKETQTAKKVIEGSKVDKNYDNYKNLRLRWVNSTSVIAKTIWVSPRTIVRYGKRWTTELHQKVDNIDKEFEVQKILEQIDVIFSQMWNTIMKDNLAWKDKVSAISNSIAPLRLKAEILWLDKWNFHFVKSNSSDFYSPNINPELYEYWNRKIEEYNIDIVELTWIRPI